MIGSYSRDKITDDLPAKARLRTARRRVIAIALKKQQIFGMPILRSSVLAVLPGAWRSSRVRYKLIMLRARIGKSFFRIEAGEFLDVDISGKLGMGAILCYAIRMHAYAEISGKKPRLICTSPLYSNGADVFERFFENPANDRPRRVLSTPASEWLIHHALPWNIGIRQAHDIFNRRFRPNAFLNSHLGGKFDLAIHYRATDKVAETGAPPRGEMIETLKAEIAQQPLKIFLATDDPTFRDELGEMFGFCEFSSYELGEVEEGTARHFSSLSPEDKATEAIVNMFLLASAPVCVRTISYLSAMVPIINPSARTVTVNAPSRPHYFPEDVIWDLENK